MEQVKIKLSDVIIFDHNILRQCMYYNTSSKRHKLNYKFYDYYGHYLKKTLSKTYIKLNILVFTDVCMFPKGVIQNAINDMRDLFRVTPNITIIGIDDYSDMKGRYIIRNFNTINSTNSSLIFKPKFFKDASYFQTFGNCIEIDNLDNSLIESSLDLVGKLNDITSETNTECIFGDKISDLIKFE